MKKHEQSDAQAAAARTKGLRVWPPLCLSFYLCGPHRAGIHSITLICALGANATQPYGRSPSPPCSLSFVVLGSGAAVGSPNHPDLT